MKIFVNVARLEIGQLFTLDMRRGHPCTLDTFLVRYECIAVTKLYFVYRFVSINRLVGDKMVM